MAASYLLPLTAPPRVLAMSAGSPHGRHGDEAYLTTFWVLNLVLGGRGTLELDGSTLALRDGSVLVVPPGVPHRYRFPRPVTKVWVHFQPASGARTVAMPVLHEPTGSRSLRADLIEAATRFLHEPERVTARVWDLLWRLGSGPVEGRTERGPLAGLLLRHVEEHLAEPLSPASLARRFRISATHLNRICSRATGMPLGAFVRRQRLERAVHLLRGSDQPIRQIAAQVGYPDLSHFNKLIRAYAGRSPSSVRSGGPSSEASANKRSLVD